MRYHLAFALLLLLSTVSVAHGQTSAAAGPPPVESTSPGARSRRPPAAYTGFGMRVENGGLPVVSRVGDASPAATAGLMVGDTLLTVDGRDPRSGLIFPDLAPGRRYALRVKRGTDELDLVLVAGPFPAERQQ